MEKGDEKPKFQLGDHLGIKWAEHQRMLPDSLNYHDFVLFVTGAQAGLSTALVQDKRKFTF